jgi:hypothetical protein
LVETVTRSAAREEITEQGDGFQVQPIVHWAVIGTLIAAPVATAITFGPPLLLATCI